MIDRIFLRVQELWVGCVLGLALIPLSSAARGPAIFTPEKLTNAAPVTPGRADGRIAFVTAKLLQLSHYSRQPFDAALSGKFYDRYVETLDRVGGEHMHFLQSDLAEFERYRTNLGTLTITGNGFADVRPASEIFNRFRQRLQQRVEYVDELLKTEKFTFNTDERIKINRKDEPYPKTLDEAKALWKQRLRFDYLQEHLAKLDAKKKAEEEAKKPSKDSAKPAAKSSEKDADAKPKSDEQEIAEKLSHNYHRALHNYADWDGADVLQVYLDTLAHVYDPHSDYMGPAPLDNFAINMNLSLFGIGAQLVSDEGYCTIQKLLPGGPALQSKKIKEKDKIIAVAQSNQTPVSVVGMRLDRAVQLIRGPKGSEVRLTIIPDGKDESSKEIVSLVRDKIKLEDQEAKAKVIDLPNGKGETFRVGMISLPSFYGNMDLSGGRRPELASQGAGAATSTTTDVARLIKKLKEENVRGMILDLRNNGGGFLEEAIRLTGLFIKEGPVVQVRDAEGNVEEESDRDPSVLYDGPLIVLANRFSASASEIVAGALQDYGRAIVVGDAATHGKGTVQSVNPLSPYMHVSDPAVTNDPGALKLTVKKFYRASGASTQLKGVTPDIVLPSIFNDAKEYGEGALENPLPWDTIETAKYEHLNRVEPYISELRHRSSERVAAAKDFDYVREDIALFKKQQADKTISLNEKKRLKEKEESEARQKAREQEMKSRKPSQEVVYDLTVKQAEQPGLPAPVEKTNSASAKLTHPPGASVPLAAKDDTKKDLDEDSDKPAPVDAVFNEAEQILMDYYGLVSKSKTLTADRVP